MSLTSPRFRTSNKLRQAAMNALPIRKGARGRAVHLLQVALLDLGYSMPRSTGGVHSPDGVDRFQNANLLGCGGHAPNRPACTVARSASQWDTAHQVGHVL